MIVEALKYLCDLQSRAMVPQLLPSNHMIDRRIVNGQVLEYSVVATPRGHLPALLDDLIALANRFFKEGGCSPAVWYSADEVVAVIDDDDLRVDRVTMELPPSDVWKVLLGLRQNKPWMTHKDFVRLLRIDLAGTLAPSVLLDRVRRIRIENGQTIHAAVSRGQESMGKSINAQVSGEAEIPETVVLEVPVFNARGEGIRYALMCSVEIDPTRLDAFRLLPMPDEMERVADDALDSIAVRLNSGLDKAIPVYRGKP